MSNAVDSGGGPPNDTKARARSFAVRVLERWQGKGFDRVVCYPSGYCSPVNSSAARLQARDGYHLHEIGSEAALDAVAASIEAGAVYRV